MPPQTQSAPSKNNLSVPIAIVVAGAMIAAAVYFGGSRGTGSLVGNVDDNFEADVAPVSAQDHILGSPNAEVVIVEYSDLECPFCKIFHGTLHRVVEDYQGRVAWAYRHYPIKELHSKAPKEAEASECAFEQGGNSAFWKYIDEVFSTTGANNTLDPAALPTIASEIGLDVAKFNACLSSGKYADKISDSIENAIKAGARGTPYSIIIKGDEMIPINGAEPYEEVKLKIDSVL